MEFWFIYMSLNLLTFLFVYGKVSSMGGPNIDELNGFEKFGLLIICALAFIPLLITVRFKR